MDLQSAQDGVQSALTAGMLLAGSEDLGEGSKPYVLRPESSVVEDLEELLPAPKRQVSSPKFYDTPSYVDYCKRFSLQETITFAEKAEESLSLRTVFNYHAIGKPSWCENQAQYVTKFSPEWSLWLRNNDKPMNQQAFAEFLEMNQLDVNQPSGAVLLEIVSNLEQRKNVAFRSSIRLSDGQTQFAYEEIIEGRDNTKGTMVVPDNIELGIRIFTDDKIGRKIPCYLRHRIHDGKLSFFYKIIQPDRIVEQAVQSRLSEIRDALPEIPLYLGSFN